MDAQEDLGEMAAVSGFRFQVSSFRFRGMVAAANTVSHRTGNRRLNDAIQPET
jgi:hypothetical protein